MKTIILQAQNDLKSGLFMFSCSALWIAMSDFERPQREAVRDSYEKLLIDSGYFTKKKIPVGDMVAESIEGNDKFDKLSDAKQLEIRLALLDKLAVLYAN